jgi:ATP-dependent helicase/nuclease subunit A
MSALPPLHNRAIAASAGSGKTYQLAHRYIELLRRGVAPDRICALTFSRKAAGEIFDTIVNCLCDAATQPDKARGSSALLDIPTDPRQFLGLLRSFVDHLHRLRIGTIDSFTVGVARAFPLELGLAPDFRVGDNDDALGAELRRDLLARLFDPSRTDPRDQREFLEAYKLATFGREDKVIGRQLEAFITDLARIYRNSPGGPSVWGSETAIWKGPLPWRRLPADAASVYAEQLSAAAGALPAKLALATQELAASLAAHDDHSEWNSKRENTLFKRLWSAVGEPDGAAFEFVFNRQTARLPTAAADALRALVRHVMAVELARGCRQTQGMARVLQLHEALYREQARRNGRLTFDDLTRLLGSDGGHPLSRTRAPDRLYIDYRLDGRLDHWLLDEFQDTSDAQWHVLRGLIDETVQDDSGQRSFFYVGDTKQAIYGWRGGNHKLFGRVRDEYNERIECRPLDESHRSAAAIIATVNQVFEQIRQEPGIPEQARHDWANIWRAHRTAREIAGCVELLEAADGSEEESGPNDALYAVVAARLREIRPAERGLRAAVLVRTNEQGRRCAELLRARCPDQAIVLDGAASLLDNALVPLMLALIRFAAHPGDTLAWRHLQMSPLGMLLANEPSPAIPPASAPLPPPALAEGDAALRAAVSLRLLRAIQEHGFLATLREWCGLLETLHALDAFGQRRRDDLFEAAAAFDATNDHDCDRFDRHVRAYAQRESVADDAVRVMTIHQSKGLGFDLVFVPFSRSGRAFTNPGRADVLTAEDDHWVLLTPPQTVVTTDPVLAQAADHRASQTAFAQLCVFYVALTRAKQGLYLVVPPPTKTETDTCREDTVLRHALAGNVKTETLPGSGQVLFRAGQAEWYAGRKKVRPNAPHAVPDAATPAMLRAGPPRLARREPSKLDLVTRPAAALFNREAGDVLAFGTAIHRLFQRVEWLDTLDVDRIVTTWRASATETAPILRDAEKQFRASLDRPDVRQALTRPPGPCVLWREKAFELMLDGSVVAGQFDRVVIGHDAGGRPVDATILDFKSNRIESDDALHRTAAGYRDQLGLYATALRRILGPSLTHIAQALLFTRAGRVVVLN